jgi:hypothetical protein
MIEVDNYVHAEDVMLFKKLALMSDDDFKHTFKKCPLHLRVQQYVQFHRYTIINVYTPSDCDNDVNCMVDVIEVVANNEHYFLALKHLEFTNYLHIIRSRHCLNHLEADMFIYRPYKILERRSHSK